MSESSAAEAPLRLIAFDADDLLVLSAHFEDAEVRMVETLWQPREKRFVLVASRLDRLSGSADRRRLAGLHVDRALSVRHQRLDPASGGVHRLQTVTFQAGEAPAGSVLFSFEGGGAIRVEVECLEVAMADLSVDLAGSNMAASGSTA